MPWLLYPQERNLVPTEHDLGGPYRQFRCFGTKKIKSMWGKSILDQDDFEPSIWKSLGNKAPANQETFTISWFNASNENDSQPILKSIFFLQVASVLELMPSNSNTS